MTPMVAIHNSTLKIISDGATLLWLNHFKSRMGKTYVSILYENDMNMMGVLNNSILMNCQCSSISKKDCPFE